MVDKRELNKPLFLQIGFRTIHLMINHEFLNRLKNKKFDYLETTEKLKINRRFEELRNLHQKRVRFNFLKLDANKSLRQIQLHHYHANITLIDNEIGQIINCLEQKNL